MRGMIPDCLLEPQDFRKDNSELIYTRCIGEGSEDLQGDVRSVNVKTGEVVIYRKVAGEYDSYSLLIPHHQSANC